jgi:hypothetical protein
LPSNIRSAFLKQPLPRHITAASMQAQAAQWRALTSQPSFRPDIVGVRKLDDADPLVLVDVGEGGLPRFAREVFEILPRS